MPIVIRARTLANIRPCIAVLRAVHEHDRYPTRWPDDPEHWLTPKGFLGAWVATLDPGIVGHVAIGCAEEPVENLVLREARCSAAELAEIMRLFLHPDLRGVGIAEKLLHEAVDYALRKSLIPMLAVNARRVQTHGFYERTGWRFVGEGPGDIMMPDGHQQMLRYYIMRE